MSGFTGLRTSEVVGVSQNAVWLVLFSVMLRRTEYSVIWWKSKGLSSAGQTETEAGDVCEREGGECLQLEGSHVRGPWRPGDGQKKGQTPPLPSHSLSILSHSGLPLHQSTSDFNKCLHAVINCSG